MVAGFADFEDAAGRGEDMTGDNHMHMDDELLREALEALEAATELYPRDPDPMPCCDDCVARERKVRATITKLEERLLRE